MDDKKIQTDYKTLMEARKEGLLVQSEREYREEQYQVVEKQIEQRKELFDSLYGDLLTQEERNDYYSIIDSKYRGRAESVSLYPEPVMAKMAKIREAVAELRDLGVNEEVISGLLRPQHTLSRLYITSDYRIFLPEYNNVEVQLRPLPRAVFLLFLRHPEGIILKEMGDYFKELLDIYKGIKGAAFREKKDCPSIQRLCNPLNNSIHEKICRIHEALRHVLDETIAMKYYITGGRSEAHQIPVPQSLVCWNAPM